MDWDYYFLGLASGGIPLLWLYYIKSAKLHRVEFKVRALSSMVKYYEKEYRNGRRKKG